MLEMPSILPVGEIVQPEALGSRMTRESPTAPRQRLSLVRVSWITRGTSFETKSSATVRPQSELCLTPYCGAPDAAHLISRKDARAGWQPNGPFDVNIQTTKIERNGFLSNLFVNANRERPAYLLAGIGYHHGRLFLCDPPLYLS